MFLKKWPKNTSKLLKIPSSPHTDYVEAVYFMKIENTVNYNCIL